MTHHETGGNCFLSKCMTKINTKDSEYTTKKFIHPTVTHQKLKRTFSIQQNIHSKLTHHETGGNCFCQIARCGQSLTSLVLIPAIFKNCGPTSEVTAKGKNSKLKLVANKLASTGDEDIGPGVTQQQRYTFQGHSLMTSQDNKVEVKTLVMTRINSLSKLAYFVGWKEGGGQF